MKISLNENESVENKSVIAWIGIAKGLVALLGLVLVVAVGLGLFVRVAGETLTSFLASMGSLDTAIIVALITGAISIITVICGGVASNAQRKNFYLRQHREEPYQKLVEMVYKMMQDSRGKSYTQDEILEDYNEFSRALTLWGSPKAIKLWNEWRLASVKGNPTPDELLLAMEQIMMQLRRDMGQKRGLGKGDLLRMFINDVDEKLL